MVVDRPVVTAIILVQHLLYSAHTVWQAPTFRNSQCILRARLWLSTRIEAMIWKKMQNLPEEFPVDPFLWGARPAHKHNRANQAVCSADRQAKLGGQQHCECSTKLYCEPSGSQTSALHLTHMCNISSSWDRKLTLYLRLVPRFSDHTHQKKKKLRNFSETRILHKCITCDTKGHRI
jgi:hypothetical protein